MEMALEFLKILEQILLILLVIGPEFGGLVASPLLATRFTNVIKAIKRELNRTYFWKQWHPFVWHIMTWAISFLASYICFRLKYDNVPAILVVCFFWSSFNSGVIEWMHRKASKNETANAVFSKIVFLDPEKTSLFDKAGAFASGIKIKEDQREEDDDGDPTLPRTVIWTEEERKENLRNMNKG